MLKRIGLAVVGSLIIFSGGAQANTTSQNAGVHRVYQNIRFVEGADLEAFIESYSTTMGQQRSVYVEQAATLMMMGAYGEEAAKMLMAFDEHIQDLRTKGRSRLGVTLEASFKAQLDELYRLYNPPVRRLSFQNAKIGLGFDTYIYGTYSVRNKGAGRPGLLMTVTVVDLATGVERSFEAHGADVSGAKMLARQVFDEYQKTKFPSQVRVLGKKLELVTHGVIEHEDGRRSAMKDLHTSARGACEVYEARLIREDEMRVLVGLGEYRSGLTLAKTGERSYFWALDGQRVLASYSGGIHNDTNMNPASFLNYVCVREIRR